MPTVSGTFPETEAEKRARLNLDVPEEPPVADPEPVVKAKK